MSIQELREYHPNELIYEKGALATHFYFVQQGSVFAEVSGKRVSLNEGQVFGDGGMVSGQYKATVCAGPNGCKVLCMPFDDLKREIGRSPPLVKLFITNLLARFEIAARLLEK